MKIFLLTTLGFIFVPQAMYAAVFQVTSEFSRVVAGEEFVINTELNSENAFINAVEGKVEFSSFLEVSRIDYEDSVINTWVEEPHVERGKIIFAGIIPGGFDGVRKPLEEEKYAGILMKVYFKARRSGEAKISIDDPKALINDGLGTAVETKIVNTSIEVMPAVGATPSRGVAIFVFAAIIILLLCIALLRKIKK